MMQPAPQTLADRLEAFKSERGETVSVDEVAALIGCLLPAGTTTSVSDHAGLNGQLRGIVDVLAQAESELAALRPRHLSRRQIPNAHDELDAVVSHTERAADRFMDVGDRLGEIAASVEGDSKAKLEALSTEILEVSTFQDITGQRVDKVRAILRLLEERLTSLAEAIGDTESGQAASDDTVFDERGEVIDQESLKHGPQLEGKGNSQDEIDAILESFD